VSQRFAKNLVHRIASFVKRLSLFTLGEPKHKINRRTQHPVPHQTSYYLLRQSRRRNWNIRIRSIRLARQAHSVIRCLNALNHLPNIGYFYLTFGNLPTDSHLNLPLFLLNILPQLPPPIPILPQPIRQPLTL